MATTIGSRIRAGLDAIGMTQRQLSEKTGLTEAAISRYIAGTREPKAYAVALIADALGMTSDDLLGIPCTNQSVLDDAVRIVARSSGEISPEQRKMLIESLMNL